MQCKQDMDFGELQNYYLISVKELFLELKLLPTYRHLFSLSVKFQTSSDVYLKVHFGDSTYFYKFFSKG